MFNTIKRLNQLVPAAILLIVDSCTSGGKRYAVVPGTNCDDYYEVKVDGSVSASRCPRGKKFDAIHVCDCLKDTLVTCRTP